MSRRQYNEAQAKAKVLALAQAHQAKAQAHTQVGKEASVNNHETGIASSTLWQSVHEADVSFEYNAHGG